MFFIYSMALMSFLGCKAASRYPLLAYCTTFYYVMFLSGIIKIGCHWTHISRRILSLQAWIKGDTAQILSCINVMYKNPSCLLPSSHLPWRQEVFTEDIGTSLKPSCTSSNHICSIHDHISKTSPFSPSFMLSRSDHTEPLLPFHLHRSAAFRVWGKWNEVRLTKPSKNTTLQKQIMKKGRIYMSYYDGAYKRKQIVVKNYFMYAVAFGASLATCSFVSKVHPHKWLVKFHLAAQEIQT